MKLAHFLLSGCLWVSTAQAIGHTPGQHPLLDLARELESSREPDLQYDYEAPDLRTAEHTLTQAQVPGDADCAGSIGASVYSELHSEVAAAHGAQGDFASAAQAYRHALACTPRSSRVLHNLADALFNARDFTAAAEYLQRAL